MGKGDKSTSQLNLLSSGMHSDLLCSLNWGTARAKLPPEKLPRVWDDGEDDFYGS